jgi:hypothetical protein
MSPSVPELTQSEYPDASANPGHRSCAHHRGSVGDRPLPRHRRQEFIRFLNTIEAQVPAGKLVHVIHDNHENRPWTSLRLTSHTLASATSAM